MKTQAFVASVFLAIITLLVLLAPGGEPVAAQRPQPTSTPRPAVKKPTAKPNNVGMPKSQQAQNVELVGQIGGAIGGVAVLGNYAYVGQGPRLVILNVSDPTGPTVLGQTNVLPGVVIDVAVAGNYAYVADYDGGLRIISAADPSHPTEVGFYNTPGLAYGVAVVGNYAYVATVNFSGLLIIDVSNPAAPSEVAFYGTPDWSMDVVVAGSYAYIAAFGAGLRIINVSDPAHPTEVGYYVTPGSVYGVAVAGNYAYVAAWDKGLRIINISDPAHSTEVGSYSTLWYANDVAVAGNYAYVADSGGRLRIIDVSNPATPSEIGFYDTPGGDTRGGVAVAGNYVYVADLYMGLRIISVANPVAPTEVGYYYTLGMAYGVAVAGNYAYVTDAQGGLHVINVANPSTPIGVGFYDTPMSAQGVAVAGNYAYVASYGGGLHIINISDPTHPAEVGFYSTDQSKWVLDVAVAGNYAYATDPTDGGWPGLHVINVSNPSAPSEAVFYQTMGSPNGVAVVGDYAYVADSSFSPSSSSGLQIINVSDPSHPTEVGFYNTPWPAHSVAVSGNYAYVTGGSFSPSFSGGLQIINVSDPSHPTEVGFYNTPCPAYSVAVAGNYAYVTAWDDSLRIINVSDPVHPAEVGYYVTLGTANSVVTAGDYAYVADEGGGLVILRFTPTYSIGFFPNSNGYQFPNYGGVTLSDFTITDMRRMFGDSAVCVMVGTNCNPRPDAVKWNNTVNQMMSGGHCDGFTTTALRFFKGIDIPSSFQAGANVTHDLLLANARRNIAYYWALQVPNPVAAARSQALQKTPNQVFAQLDSAMSGGASDPTTLIVYNSNGTSGHSILPYAIENQGGGTYWIDVYDNNYPNDATRHVVLNTTSNTWSYNLGGSVGTWSGNATTHSLGAIPLSTYAQQPQCPWCSGGSSSQVSLNGKGHLLITNSQGQRIGYVGSQFVDEIPSAFGSVPPGGLGIPEEPIYTLPVTDTYSTLLDGQILTQTQTVAVTQFGPGYADSADGVTLQPTSHDTLIFASDGTQLGYHSSDTKPVTLTLALDGATQSNQFQIKGVNVGTGQVITTSVDTVQGKLVLNDSQDGGSTYALNITRVTGGGTQIFAHSGIPLSATDTQYLNYGAWNGSGPMTLQIDQGSQGRISQTVTLTNQASIMYLPFIRK